MASRKQHVSKLQKQRPRRCRDEAARDWLRHLRIEPLEERRVLAVGPELVAVRPNTGGFLLQDNVLHQAPTELVLQFSPGQEIDPATLQAGIHLTRSGLDAKFSPASVMSDFNTNGAVLLQFESVRLGSTGNGVSLVVSGSPLGTNVAPQISVNRGTISVVLNTTPFSETTARQLVDALNGHSAASSLLRASIAAGNPVTNITTPAFRQASTTTDFSTGGAVQVLLASTLSGEPGNGTVVRITKASIGNGGPQVSVDIPNKTVLVTIDQTLPTTASQLVSALNSNAAALVNASVSAGNSNQNINGIASGSQFVLGGARNVSTDLVLRGAAAAEATHAFATATPNDVRLRFTADAAGAAGNSIQLVVSKAIRPTGGVGVSVTGSTINVELDSTAGRETTARQLIQALHNSAAASALIDAALLLGTPDTKLTGVANGTKILLGGANDVEIQPGFIGIGDNPNEVIVRFAETLPDDDYRLELFGTATTASATTDFNTGNSVRVRFSAIKAGALGDGTVVNISAADRGPTGGVGLAVSGNTLTIELNTNSGNETTAQQLIDQLNSDPVASQLVRAQLAEISSGNFGNPSTDIASTAGNISLTLSSSFRTPLANVRGESFNSGLDLGLQFELDLGAQIVSVVPQPIDRHTQEVALTGSPGNGTFTLTFAGQTTGPIAFNATAAVVKNALEALEAIDTVNVSGTGPWTITFPNASASNPVSMLVGSGAGLRTAGGATGNFGVRATQVLSSASRADQIDVYFNADELDPAYAQDPKYYQLIDTRATADVSDDAILIPQSVAYSSQTNLATLTFAAALPEGTYRLKIGNSDESNDTIATANRLGTLFHFNPAVSDYTHVAYTGDARGAEDVDLYRVELQPGATILASVTPHGTHDTNVRLFDANGAPIALNDAGGAGQPDTVSYTNATGSVQSVYVGIAAKTNAAYDPSDPGNSGVPSGTVSGGSTGSYRIDLNVDAAVAGDNNSSFGTSTNLGSLGSAPQTVSAQITEQSVFLVLPAFPGGNDEPGARHVAPQSVLGPIPADNYSQTENQGLGTPEGRDGLLLGAIFDADQNIYVIDYNFQSGYGLDLQGNSLSNAITENQRQRTREVFELIGRLAGVQFRETSSSGITVVTGDMRAIDVTTPVGPGEPFGRFGRTNTGLVAAIMDANETDYGSSEYGGKWFKTAFEMIGHALGLGSAYDLPSIMADPQNKPDGVGLSGNPIEPVFPGDYDILSLNRLYRPDSTDIDLYRFQIDQPGVFTAETIAERMTRSSLLNTGLRLYREVAPGQFELVAQNDDYFGNDSLISLTLEPGVYFVGVSSTGNMAYDPAVSNSGFGGTTDGAYELKLSFAPQPQSTMLDKAAAITFTGRDIRDGDWIEVNDGVNPAVRFEFDNDGVANSGGHFLVPFTSSSTAADLAKALRDQINAADASTTVAFQVSAQASGPRIRLSGQPLVSRSLVNDIVDFSVSAAAVAAQGEVVGTQLDGNSDRSPGGEFNFWFEAATGTTLYVDRTRDITAGVDGNGSLASPYDTISAALFAAKYRMIAPLAGGDAAQLDGRTFVINDGTNPAKRFEFNVAGDTTFVDVDENGVPDNVLVTFAAGATPDDLALAIEAAINGQTGPTFGISASRNGRVVSLAGASVIANTASLDVSDTPILINTPNIVRIVGNGDVTDFPANARPYLLGIDDLGVPLRDGATFEVPQGTTVMIDEGALFKNQAVVFDAGSSSPNIDRGAGAIQVLGTPFNLVNFRSYHNDAVGGDSDGPRPPAKSGDWGGIAFRDDSDLEQAGVYLNWVNHALLSNGGGKVNVDSVEQVFTPVHMVTARPTVAYNVITNSADAGISADPNSFDDSQGRIGPDVHGNRLTGNSINALFVRIDTNAGVPLDKLEVPARWDDTDIVHVVTENLQIVGAPGGPIITSKVQQLKVTGNPTGGTYRLQFNNGTTTATTQPIAFNAPTNVSTNEVQRLSVTGGLSGSFGLFWTSPDGITDFSTGIPFNATSAQIAQALASMSHINPGEVVVTGGPLNSLPVNIEFRGRYAGIDVSSLSVFSNSVTPAGALTVTDNAVPVILSIRDHLETLGIIRDSEKGEENTVHNPRDIIVRGGPLPAVPITIEFIGQYAGVDVPGVTAVNVALTGGSSPGVDIDTVANAAVTSRTAGRLAIDPGIVVKLEGARVETELGASQLIAEGTTENPIIFTAQKDDRYGAGGTFDTTSDGTATQAVPGQWGGLFFGPGSTVSIDHALITYGGGRIPIEGDFDQFNAVEIHQAKARIANSVLENNASGLSDTDRNGRGVNREAVVFVRGAQPIIVDNVFRDNMLDRNGQPADTAMVSINANALTSGIQADYGRSRGPINVITNPTNGLPAFTDNHGPLIRRNLISNNGLNGMEVRGEELTTETIWDDTDIVHVLQANPSFPQQEQVVVMNHHSFSGLTLQSSTSESLVVKLSGPNAGFLASGTPLDIDDRIGGTVQVLGFGDFPVVLTSLQDDGFGASFDTSGQPHTDTNNDGNESEAVAGDWMGIVLDEYSNDRNVIVLNEVESSVLNAADVNLAPGTAQFLGELAPNEKSGDDNRTLGFTVNGLIATDDPTDVDVFSFRGTAGTEVWLDLDRTASALDAVVELIGSNGTLQARSVTSDAAGLTSSVSVTARTLIKDDMLGGDFYSVNPKDSGMRLVLPGTVGTVGTYFVRVRSNTAPGNINDVFNGGLTRGQYQLQIRLRQLDEKAGSNVRFANILYPRNGILVQGLPAHSPLVGETGEGNNTANNAVAGADPIGNLLNTDRNVLSVSGNLSSANDVDIFRLELGYDLIQAINNVNDVGRSFATILDIDYADQLARPDTILSVFDAAGNLVLVARDSDILDDQPLVGEGNDFDDLSRGSLGELDPYIGNVQLPTGAPGTTTTYYVAVSSNRQMPDAIDQTFNAGTTTPLVRLEPINSIQRIVEDHIGFTGYTTGDDLEGTEPDGVRKIDPDSPALLPMGTIAELSTHVVPFKLSDVQLFVTTGSSLVTVNPFNGQSWYTLVNNYGFSSQVQDLDLRPDGRMYVYRNPNPGTDGDGTEGRVEEIDIGQGTGTLNSGAEGLPMDEINSNSVGAITTAWVNFSRQDFYYAIDSGPNSSRIYTSANNSIAVPPQTQGYGRVGTVSHPQITGNVTGLAFDGDFNNLFGVSRGGQFFQISTGGAAVSNLIDFRAALGGAGFTGLTRAPQNLAHNGTLGGMANWFFATTTDGRLVAINPAQQKLEAIFDSNNDGVADSIAANLGVSGASGLAFSPLDFNLWHPTIRRWAEAGHGVNPAFDDSRDVGENGYTVFGGNSGVGFSGESVGGASFYFGLEEWSSNPDWFSYHGGNDGQYGLLGNGIDWQRVLTTQAGNGPIGFNYNVPGGAHGILQTGDFSLEGYSRTDKPTLYFNYYLDTENRNSRLSDTLKMRDSARVFVSVDGGLTWDLVATNNSALTNRDFFGNPDAELPTFISASRDQFPAGVNQQVQELFDVGDAYNGRTAPPDSWRQARVDLADYAGASDVRLRFDFSTAGVITPDFSMDGDFVGAGFFNGNANQARHLDNNHEGWYIDDIIVGFAEHGEMITGNTAQRTTFFTAPQNPTFAAPAESLVGEYQLEIRRGTTYIGNDVSKYDLNDPASPLYLGEPLSPINGNTPGIDETKILFTYDTNERMVRGFTIVAPDGTAITDAARLFVSDGVVNQVFEFDNNNQVAVGNIAIGFTGNETSQQLARNIRDAINSAGSLQVTADIRLANGALTSSRVDLVGATEVRFDSVPVNLTVSFPATPDISEAPGNRTTTVRVTRETSNVFPLTSPLTVSVTSSDPSQALLVDPSDNGRKASISVVIPAGSAFVDVVVESVDDVIADGLRSSIITAATAGFDSVVSTVNVADNDASALTVDLTDLAGNNNPVSEAAGASTIRATLTRNNVLPGQDAGQIAYLTTLDTSEIKITNNTVWASQNIDGLDWTTTANANIGDQAGNDTSIFKPHISIDAAADGTFDFYSFTVTGASAATPVTGIFDIDGTTGGLNAALHLFDSSGNLLRSNLTGGNFNIVGRAGSTTNQDPFIEYSFTQAGTYILGIGTDATTVSTPSYPNPVLVGGAPSTGGYTLHVSLDNAPPRDAHGDSTMTVIFGPGAGTIGAGALDVFLSPVRDFVADGNQSAGVVAWAPGFPNGMDSFTVSDNAVDQLQLAVTILGSTSISENGGTTTGRVTRQSPAPTDTPLVVNLLSSDTSEASVPFSVTIPAGQSFANFTIRAVNDPGDDGNQTTVITAYTSGYSSATTVPVTVTDDDATDADRLAAVVGGVSFAGQARNTGANDPQVDVPDISGAVGDTYIVEATSARVRIYDKTGVQQSDTSLNQFFINAGIAGAANTSSPRIIYDAATSRFYAVAAEGNTAFLVARSNTSDPRAPWTGFRLDADADNTHNISGPIYVGLDGDAVYITADMALASGGAAVETNLAVVRKSTFTAFSSRLLEAVQSITGPSPQPSVETGGSGEGGALLSADASSDTIIRTRVINVTTTPSLVQEAVIPVAAFAASNPVTQQGPFPPITHSSPAFGGHVVEVGDQLWAVHAVSGGAGSQLRWYVVDETTNALLDSGTISDANLSFMNPSINVSQGGDVVIGYTVVGAAQFPAGFVSVGHASVHGTTTETTFSSPTLIPIPGAAGGGKFSAPTATWGRYSTTALDPANPSRIWTFQEHATGVTFNTGAIDQWVDRIADIMLPDEQRDITLTVTGGGPTVTEGDGAGARNLQVTRTDTTTAATIVVATTDTGEITLGPGGTSTVTLNFAIGDASQNVQLNVVDDGIGDGTQTVPLIASAYGYDSVTTTLDVLDDDAGAAVFVESITAPNPIGPLSENFSTAVIVVRRTGTTDGAVTVDLRISDTSEATISPSQVTIPAGQSTAVVNATITRVNDSLLDFDQTAFVVPSAPGYDSIWNKFDVQDNETPQLFVNIAAFQIDENAGANATTATISVANVLQQDVVVTIVSNDKSEVTLTNPTTGQTGDRITAIIPAGQTSVTINLNAVDELTTEPVNRLVQVLAYATHFASAADTVQVNTIGAGATGAGIQEYNRLGDQNVHREQGQVRIEGTTIRYPSVWGINVEAGARDNGGNTPHPGPVRNLPTLNTERLVPGVTIANSVVANLGGASGGGIRVSGDPSGNPQAASPFVRIVNNTVFGEPIVQPGATSTEADVVFVIDASTSMAADIAALKNNIAVLNQQMTARNVNARYGLVIYPRQGSGGAQDPILVQDLVDFATFVAPGSVFQSLSTTANSNREAGSEAILEALNQLNASTTLSFRSTALPVPILMSDEDDDSLVTDQVRALSQLLSQKAIFFGITLDPGAEVVPEDGTINNTASTYQTFATATNGRLFEIDKFRANPAVFFQDFAQRVATRVSGGAAGVGIRIENGASPTILNNLIANTNQAIQALSTATTVIGANFFQNNVATGPTGTNPIINPVDGQGVPLRLFVDQFKGNFYLASGTPAIDSSLNSLQDRPNFVAVKSPLGIPESPMLAPTVDGYGQLRLDDPTQNSPPGLGTNIFKDRGAVERADFAQGLARLASPIDVATGDQADCGDPAADLDCSVSNVWLDQPPFFSEFVVELVDSGVGIDDSLVSSLQFQLIQDGVVLTDGLDYFFTYNKNTNLASFTAVTTFPLDHKYAIQVDNSSLTGIRDLAGNLLQGNQADGSIRFTVLLTDGQNDPPQNALPGAQSVNEDAGTLITPTTGGGTLRFTERNSSDSVRVDLVDPGAANRPLTIAVAGAGTGNATVSISLATNASGAITTTASQLIAALQADLVASTLVGVSVTGAGTNTVRAASGFVGHMLVFSTGGGVLELPAGTETVRFTERQRSGDQITVNVVVPGAINSPLSVTVTGVGTGQATVTVRLATDPVGLVTTTTDQLVAAIQTHDVANSLMTVTATGTALATGGTGVIGDTRARGSSNLLAVSDPDAFLQTSILGRAVTEEDGVLQVTLTAVNGQIILAGTTGLTFAVGDNPLGDDVITMTGSVASINAALNGMRLRLNDHHNQNIGPTSLTITTEDLGRFGPPFPGTTDPQVAMDQIALTVNALNDAPQFTVGPNPPATPEDSGLITVVDWASDVRPGPAGATDEVGQSLTFVTQIVSRPAGSNLDFATLQVVQSAGDPTKAELRYEPLPNRFGSAVIAVRLQDNGSSAQPNSNLSAAQTFTITVNPLNDPPTAVNDTLPAADQVMEDSPKDIATSVVLANDSDVDGDALTVESVSAIGGVTKGTVTLLGTTITYNPNGQFESLPQGATATDTFRYTVRDPSGATASATVTVTIVGQNDAPVANNDQNSDAHAAGQLIINEDTQLVIPGATLRANDTDVDTGSVLSIVTVTNSAAGATVMLNANGTITYDPRTSDSLQRLPQGGSGTDTFTYRISDGSAVSNIATVTVTVTGVDDLPDAKDDDDGNTGGKLNTTEDVALPIAASVLLANDVDDLGDTDTVVSVAPIAGQTRGSVSLSGTTINYSPVGVYDFLTVGQTVTDVFAYTIRDNLGMEDTATVTVTVRGVNDLPVPTNDSGTTAADTVLNVAARGLLDNDSDADTDETGSLQGVAETIVSQLGATVTIRADGSYSYDPRTSAAQVNFRPLRPQQTTVDTFTYRIQDVNGGISAVRGTVSITVGGVNDPPQAFADSGTAAGQSLTINENSVLTINAPGVLANDTDIDGDPIQVVITPTQTVSSRGVPVTLSANGSFSYDPRSVAAFQQLTAGQSLTDTFVYTIQDLPAVGLSRSGPESVATVTITITGVNDAPTPSADDYTSTPVSEDVVFQVNAANGLLQNDVDEEGNSMTAVAGQFTSASGATINVLADGSFTYDPRTSNAIQLLPTGATLTDTFTYTVRDSSGNVSTPATVTLRVLGVNDAPRPVNDDNTTTAGNLLTTEDNVLEILEPTLLANDIDDTGNTFVIVSVGPSGTKGLVELELSFSGAKIRYNPNHQFDSLKVGEQATDTFVYTIRDQDRLTGTGTVTVTITGVNDAPLTNADTYTVDEDSLLNVAGIGVLFNDSDAEGDAISVVPGAVTSTLGAAVTLNANGTFSYNPTAVAALQALDVNATLQDTFTYTATDGTSQSTGTVTVTVTGQNDAPRPTNDTYTVSEEATLTVNAAQGLLANDADPESHAMRATLESAPLHGSVTVNPDGSLSYSPVTNFFGTDTFTYRVADASSSAVGTVTINVTGTNDSPTAVSDSYSVNQDSVLAVSASNGLLVNDTDPDQEALRARRLSGPSRGTVTVNNDGSFTYTPQPGFFGTDTFQYQAFDAAGAASTATVTINVLNTRPWRNPQNALDVNGDGFVTPQDVLLIVNYLNANGSGPVPTPAPPPPPYRDTNGDNFITPNDALLVINFLNQSVGEGEGESSSAAEVAPPLSTNPVLANAASALGQPEAKFATPAIERSAVEFVDEVFGDSEPGVSLTSGMASVAGVRSTSDDEDAEDELSSLIEEIAAQSADDDRDSIFGWFGR